MGGIPDTCLSAERQGAGLQGSSLNPTLHSGSAQQQVQKEVKGLLV